MFSAVNSLSILYCFNWISIGRSPTTATVVSIFADIPGRFGVNFIVISDKPRRRPCKLTFGQIDKLKLFFR